MWPTCLVAVYQYSDVIWMEIQQHYVSYVRSTIIDCYVTN